MKIPRCGYNPCGVFSFQTPSPSVQLSQKPLYPSLQQLVPSAGVGVSQNPLAAVRSGVIVINRHRAKLRGRAIHHLIINAVELMRRARHYAAANLATTVIL